MSVDTTRRTVLKAAATIPALSALSVPAAAATAETPIAALFQEWEKRQSEYEALNVEIKALYARIESRAGPRPSSRDAAYEAKFNADPEACKIDDIFDRMDENNDRLDPLRDDILKAVPQSIHDVALQMRVVIAQPTVIDDTESNLDDVLQEMLVALPDRLAALAASA